MDSIEYCKNSHWNIHEKEISQSKYRDFLMKKKNAEERVKDQSREKKGTIYVYV